MACAHSVVGPEQGSGPALADVLRIPSEIDTVAGIRHGGYEHPGAT
jgi:hypothetical protein